MFTLLIMCVVGCSKVILRTSDTYLQELHQYNNWVTVETQLLRQFVEDNCSCINDTMYTTNQCYSAALYITVIEARHSWHYHQSLCLGGQDKYCTDTPLPDIPPITCPLQ